MIRLDAGGPTEPGKSTRKGVTVVLQGAMVMGLVTLALDKLNVSNPETWIMILTPLLTGLLHGLQKWVLHVLGYEVRFEVESLPGARFLPVLLCGFLALGCATASTRASISQTDPSGFTESVSFHNLSIVGWGSKHELQDGELLYRWDAEGGQFGAGGQAVGQVSSDPVTAITARVLDRLIDRALPPPAPEVPDPEPPTIDEILDGIERVRR